MVKPGEQPPSTFNARADTAALALRRTLNQQGRQVPENAPVAVGPDGKPPAPLPPVGSYARQAIERMRAEQALIGDQPPAGTPEQAVDGSQAPPLLPGQGQPEPAEPLSPRAERRIKELIDQLREKDQALQQALAEGKKTGETVAQMEARLNALSQEHQQMLQANLDHLDPETRMQVMQDSRLGQRLDEFEKRILGRIQPQLQHLNTVAQQSEMQILANKYPSFDIQIHGPLIDLFRGKNPNCTIEQAFRAIAEPEELVTRQAASAAAVPTVIPPGNASMSSIRFAPAPEARSDPAAELVDEAQRFKALRASSDPAKQKEGMNLAHEHLKRRLGYR